MADGIRWLAGQAGFFRPVRACARVFRRLFLQHLQTTTTPARHLAGPLRGPAGWVGLGDHTRRGPADGVDRGRQAPVRRAAHFVDYVSGYTQRVAFPNRRLLDMDGGQVRLHVQGLRDDHPLGLVEPPDMPKSGARDSAPRPYGSADPDRGKAAMNWRTISGTAESGCLPAYPRAAPSPAPSRLASSRSGTPRRS